MDGKETQGHLTWRVDTQDSATVPSRGTLAHVTFDYIFDGPEITVTIGVHDRAQQRRTAAAVRRGEQVQAHGERKRLFVLGGAGTSFGHQPLPVDQFPLGRPFHLGAYSVGEVRGDHYVIATVGYVRELGRMPDFLGGPIFAGGWLENGDAFDDWDDATLRTHVSGGLIVDTLVGPGDSRRQRRIRRPLADVHRHRPVVPLSRHTSP